jgi:hypothetical protein
MAKLKEKRLASVAYGVPVQPRFEVGDLAGQRQYTLFVAGRQ